MISVPFPTANIPLSLAPPRSLTFSEMFGQHLCRWKTYSSQMSTVWAFTQCHILHCVDEEDLTVNLFSWYWQKYNIIFKFDAFVIFTIYWLYHCIEVMLHPGQFKEKILYVYPNKTQSAVLCGKELEIRHPFDTTIDLFLVERQIISLAGYRYDLCQIPAYSMWSSIKSSQHYPGDVGGECWVVCTYIGLNIY